MACNAAISKGLGGIGERSNAMRQDKAMEMKVTSVNQRTRAKTASGAELTEEQLRKVTGGGLGNAAFLSADHVYASFYWRESRRAF
jgi:hypothetical protein